MEATPTEQNASPSGALSLSGALRTELSPSFTSDRLVRPAVMMNNEAFSCFVFYSVLLVIKMYILAIITGQVRLRKKVSDLDK